MDPRKGFNNNTVGKEEEETGELFSFCGTSPTEVSHDTWLLPPELVSHERQAKAEESRGKGQR